MPSRTRALPDWSRAHREVTAYQQFAQDMGHSLDAQSRVLDIGCGHGNTTLAFWRQGIEGYGLDVLPHWSFSAGVQSELDSLKAERPILQTIDLKDYRFPFPENHFDFVFSNMVLEHAQNYAEMFAEISRVLRPDGFSLHVFPSRYLPIEPHVLVPFATIFQNYPYLRFWAGVGIRNSYQRGFAARATALRNLIYLRRRTTYYTMKQIREQATPHFGEVSIASAAYGRTTFSNKRHVYRAVRLLPAANILGNTFLERVLLLRAPRKSPGLAAAA